MDPKTRVFVAAHSKDFVILPSVILKQYSSVTERRTEKRTDTLTTTKTRYSITHCRA